MVLVDDHRGLADKPWAQPVNLLGGSWLWSLVALGVATLFIGITFYDAWASMVRTWINTTTYHHGFIVLPISAFLVWRERDALKLIPPTQEPLGLILILGAGLVWVLGQAGDVQVFSQIGALGTFIAVFITLLGREVTRHLIFPLIFLGFMVPIGDELVPTLQMVTAEFSVGLLRIIGIPVFHDGIMITTPSGLFEVAAACAGIRFLIANIVVAALFAYLSYKTVWKWALFMARAVIIPIIANGFRAFGIIYVAYLTDNEVATGVDHIV